MSTGFPLESVRGTFRAIVRATVPAAADLDEPDWVCVEEIATDALAPRPASMIRQLVLFLRGLSALSLLRHGRRLERLAPDKAVAFLRAFERSPVLLVRRGLWGVRTLAFMGYYARPDAQRALGYGAVPDGWASGGRRTTAWADRGGAAGPEPAVLDVLNRARDNA